MADRPKMSVAEILAAARKVDGGGESAAASKPTDDSSTEAASAAETTATSSSDGDGDAPAAKPPAKKIPAKGAGRPSVAEMLALARAEKDQAESSAPAPPKPAKSSPPPKSSPKPAAAKATAAPAKSKPVDSQSILAAARKPKDHRPGPITKAEAAAKGQPVVPKAKLPKEQIVVPSMPVKPEYAKPAAARSKDEIRERRSFLLGMSALATGFVALSVTSLIWVFGTIRFMFPNVLREPPNRFKVGFPDQFPPEQVETKFKAKYGIWVVNTSYHGQQEIFALKSVCTHLGCTPNWLEAEQKFKCPCHGSGFYKDGINFEGPAPRPLERYAISVADDGQIEVNKSRIFQEEMGQWTEPASYVPV